MAVEDDSPPGGTGPTGANRRQKPPLTIDLEAAPEAATVVPPRAPWPALIVAGVVGGIVAAGLAAILYSSGLAPSPAEGIATAAATRADEAVATVAALAKRVDAIEARPAAAPDGTPALAERLTRLEAFEQENQGRVAALEARPAASPAVTPDPAATQALADLKLEVGALAARIAAVESTAAAAPAVAPAAAVAALGDRLALVEASLNGLSARLTALAARPTGAVESERAARAVAIGVVRAAAAKGGAFAGDLAMLRTLGFDDATLASLAPLAARGAPSLADLQAGFPGVADAILDATSAAGPDAGFLDRVSAFGRSLVSVRPTAPIPGTTPEAIVSRMQAAVDGGNLAEALSERGGLPETGQSASAAWASGAADRVAIDRLVDALGRAPAPGN